MRAVDHDLERRLDEAANEGLDSELVRQCHELLAEPLSTWTFPRPPLTSTARRRTLEHLLVARLAFEVELWDRAAGELAAVLQLSPGDERALRLQAAMFHRRGRLSDAIAIWQTLCAPQTVGARSSLRDLSQVLELSLHRAADRGRPAPPELEAALQGALPVLEQSFRSALHGHLVVALRSADALATRYQGKDRHVLKTVAIHRAWLLEQAGNVHEAIVTLERLADEPGLARDVERLLCLSRLYEREGTPERIRRAVRAVRYAYLSTREATLLRRLSRLLETLGHGELASRFEARYEEVFRRRMSSLNVRDLARAALLRYVPVPRLRAVAASWLDELGPMVARHLARRRPEHERRAAVLSLILNDAPRARSMLASLDQRSLAGPIDLFYWADAESELGRHDVALELRRRAMNASDLHADAVAWVALVDAVCATGRSDVLAAEPRARLDEAANRVRRLAYAHASHPDGWRALSHLEALRGDATRAAQLSARAVALSNNAPPPGRTLAAAAFRHGGEIRGLMHELWVDAIPAPDAVLASAGGWLDPNDVLGAVSAELRVLAVNVFSAVRAFAVARFPERIAAAPPRRFLLRFTKDDETSSGESAGLPIALAFFSALVGVSLPAELASTGAIVCDAHDVIVVRRVGDIEAKIEGAFERRLDTVLVPRANRDDVHRAERVPKAVAASLVRYVATFDEACALLFPELH